MEVDRNGLEVLEDDECVQLLARARIGRIGLSLGALPVILPVQFVLDGRDPIFRTAVGSKLDAAMNGQVLCLEADGSNVTYHDGWSVLATGRAEVITDVDELARVRRLPLEPWVPGATNHYVRIRTALLSGRRISMAARRAATPV